MKLIAIARSVQPFIKKKYGINDVYRELVDNQNLNFMTEVIKSPSDFITLCFLTYKISKGENVDNNVIDEIKKNLFLFNEIEFHDENSTIGCDTCSGDGYVTCSDCDGDGRVDCDNCDEGKISCDDCGGDGSIEVGDNEWEDCVTCSGEGNTECSECDGEGRKYCDNCDGNGSEDCSDCGGRGDFETDEYIPYTVSIYASYSNDLKDKIIYKSNRNKKGPVHNDNCLLVYRRDYVAGEGESGDINHVFQNNIYCDSVVDENIDSILSTRAGTFNFRPTELIYISDKFTD